MVIIVFSGRTEANSFHGVSMLAQLVRVEVNQDYLWSVAPTSGTVDEAVERSLYCRDFDSVHLAISAMLDDHVPVNTASLETLSKRIFNKDQESTNFTIGSEQDQVVFEEDLKRRQLTLPNSPLNNALISREAPLQASIEIVRIKLALKDSQDLYGLIDSFDKLHLASMPSSLLFEVMCKLVGGGKDKKLALEKAIQILPLFGQRLDSEGCRIVHLLLYPTIFDETALPIDDSDHIEPMVEPNRPVTFNSPIDIVKKDTPIDLRRAVRTTKTAIQMLSMELANDDNSNSDQSSQHRQTTISFGYHWRLLQSFVENGCLDDYFLHTCALQKHYPTATPCHRLLAWHRDQKIVPKLDFVFDQAASEKRATLTLRSLLTVCRIVHAAAQSNVPLSAGLDASLVAGVRAVLRGQRWSECMWFGGYQELRVAVKSVNVRDRQLKRIASSALIKELQLLHSKLL